MFISRVLCHFRHQIFIYKHAFTIPAIVHQFVWKFYKMFMHSKNNKRMHILFSLLLKFAISIFDILTNDLPWILLSFNQLSFYKDLTHELIKWKIEDWLNQSILSYNKSILVLWTSVIFSLQTFISSYCRAMSNEHACRKWNWSRSSCMLSIHKEFICDLFAQKTSRL